MRPYPMLVDPFGVLIPRIPFVQRDVVQLAYPPQLILERYLPVVLLLTLYIRYHGIHVTVAHAEPTPNRAASSSLECPRCEGGRRSQRPIPVLPIKTMEQTPALLIDPTGRARFHRPHNLRQVHLFSQEEKDMHMVSRPAHLNGRTPVIVENLRHIRMHLRQMRLRNRVRPTLRREHQMDVYLR